MPTLLHNPKSEAPITEVLVWVARDADGNEGIMAAMLDPMLGTTVFVTSKLRVAVLLQSRAEEIARLAGQTAHLLRFTNREEVRLD